MNGALDRKISFQHSTREYYATVIRATRIKTAPTHASADWYVENLLPVVTLRFVAKYRQVIWQGRVLNSQLTDEELRNKDEEIGLLLSALGFTTNTRLYLASQFTRRRSKLFPVIENTRKA
ncbi:hypothetical protein F2Q70_00033021 [Brassica cretica]|uniref:Uncharacterized protein n=1 Tax=Brassica cretica TaxID=69181 RepID=A0A3N6QC51_BRACR|nr:hypothetical protein F2Q70_00033021 [Brassica cretica]KAF3596144.1 hypothetical protein DY000_02027248 [Brassica cretica]